MQVGSGEQRDFISSPWARNPEEQDREKQFATSGMRLETFSIIVVHEGTFVDIALCSALLAQAPPANSDPGGAVADESGIAESEGSGQL